VVVVGSRTVRVDGGLYIVLLQRSRDMGMPVSRLASLLIAAGMLLLDREGVLPLEEWERRKAVEAIVGALEKTYPEAALLLKTARRLSLLKAEASKRPHQ
jgi:hypothetical protein